MKIVNLESFRKLPEGTIFSKYKPCSFSDLECKGETWENDFIASPMTGNIEYSSSDEFLDKCLHAEESGESIGFDFDATQRDGLFDKDQLFAVYEITDVKQFIDKLQRCLKQGYRD